MQGPHRQLYGDAFGMMICGIIPGPDSKQMVQFVCTSIGPERCWPP